MSIIPAAHRGPCYGSIFISPWTDRRTQGQTETQGQGQELLGNSNSGDSNSGDDVLNTNTNNNTHNNTHVFTKMTPESYQNTAIADNTDKTGEKVREMVVYLLSWSSVYTDTVSGISGIGTDSGNGTVSGSGSGNGIGTDSGSGIGTVNDNIGSNDTGNDNGNGFGNGIGSCQQVVPSNIEYIYDYIDTYNIGSNTGNTGNTGSVRYPIYSCCLGLNPNPNSNPNPNTTSGNIDIDINTHNTTNTHNNNENTKHTMNMNLRVMCGIGSTVDTFVGIPVHVLNIAL